MKPLTIYLTLLSDVERFNRVLRVLKLWRKSLAMRYEQLI